MIAAAFDNLAMAEANDPCISISVVILNRVASDDFKNAWYRVQYLFPFVYHRLRVIKRDAVDVIDYQMFYRGSGFAMSDNIFRTSGAAPEFYAAFGGFYDAFQKV